MNRLLQLVKSFGYAAKGISLLFRGQQNAWIHLFGAIAAVILGLVYNINPIEWVAITIVIGLVFAAELFNTSIEFLADKVSPGRDAKIGRVKDLAAGAVLVMAVTALITGLIIFIPKIF